MLCGHVADSFRFPMLIAASAAAHCGRLTAPPIVLCFALFSPLQKQQRRERKQEWQARAAAEFVFCDEQMDPAATTRMAATAAAARSGGVKEVDGDAMAKTALESLVASDVASEPSTKLGEIQAGKEESNSQANRGAQASHGSHSTGLNAKKEVMDLLSAMNLEFDVGRKLASSRSGGRIHALN